MKRNEAKKGAAEMVDHDQSPFAVVVSEEDTCPDHPLQALVP